MGLPARRASAGNATVGKGAAAYATFSGASGSEYPRHTLCGRSPAVSATKAAASVGVLDSKVSPRVNVHPMKLDSCAHQPTVGAISQSTN